MMAKNMNVKLPPDGILSNQSPPLDRLRVIIKIAINSKSCEHFSNLSLKLRIEFGLRYLFYC